MSTSSLSSSTSTSTYGALSSQGTGAPLQLTGLASGLDTNGIINSLIAIQSQPITHLTNQQNGLKALNAQLTRIQSTLQNLALDAQAIGLPTLFTSSQAVTSSDPTRITAASSSGAGVGGYQVSVTQLANSAQRTFAFTSPSAADTITIDGHDTNVAAGASAADVVSAINGDSSATVYAASTNTGTIVLSDRTTGNTGSSYIQLSDPGGAMTEQTGLGRQGQDAMFSVDGVSGSSSSNTVTSAIAGVSLTLGGVTTTSGPVTVSVAAPAANVNNIGSALQTFVTAYNSAIDQISAQLNAAPSTSDPTQGTLYHDSGLSDLLAGMRTAMYQGGSGLPAGMASLMDLGVSTGAASGGATPSQDAINGHLTIDATKLTAAIQSSPGGVAKVLQSWSQNMSTLVNATAQPAGTIDSRLSGDSAQISRLGDKITSLQSSLAVRRASLTQQFSKLEAALSSNQSESNWLASSIAALP